MEIYIEDNYSNIGVNMTPSEAITVYFLRGKEC